MTYTRGVFMNFIELLKKEIRKCQKGIIPKQESPSNQTDPPRFPNALLNHRHGVKSDIQRALEAYNSNLPENSGKNYPN
jgi:hypothetical protein